MSDAVAPAARRTTRSGELFERALAVLVDGVASPSRGTLNYRPSPLFMARGEGGEIVDVDGNRYVDLMLAYGALPHGHAHPRLVRAAQEAVARSALLATATEIEIEVAERLTEMIPGAERVRLANTGTEACMAALRLVRGLTGRPKVLKFEGHYHGWSDGLSLGSNPGALDRPDTLGVLDLDHRFGREQGAPLDGLLSRPDEARVGVPVRERAVGEHQVDVAVAVHVDDLAALAVGHEERVGAVVDGAARG